MVTINDTVHEKHEQTNTYCTLRRRSTDIKKEYISNVRLDFPAAASAAANNSSSCSIIDDHQDPHRVRKLVKSAESSTEEPLPLQLSSSSVSETTKSETRSSKEVGKIDDAQESKNNTDYTSDDDDLSHAEELSYSSQVTSTSVESLNSNHNAQNIVLPTGWHRHPHHGYHHSNQSSLGPLDEIVHAETDDEDEDIYASVMKNDSTLTTGKSRYNSVLRSSRITRRHTTYVKQFDSLPLPQATLMSTNGHKPHVHSWHRHGKRSKQVRHPSFFFK